MSQGIRRISSGSTALAQNSRTALRGLGFEVDDHEVGSFIVKQAAQVVPDVSESLHRDGSALE